MLLFYLLKHMEFWELKNQNPSFADVLRALADKVENGSPISLFLYVHDDDDEFSVPYHPIDPPEDASEEARQAIMVSTQLEVFSKLARHLEIHPMFDTAQELMDLEDSGEIKNMVEFH